MALDSVVCSISSISSMSLWTVQLHLFRPNTHSFCLFDRSLSFPETVQFHLFRLTRISGPSTMSLLDCSVWYMTDQFQSFGLSRLLPVHFRIDLTVIYRPQKNGNFWKTVIFHLTKTVTLSFSITYYFFEMAHFFMLEFFEIRKMGLPEDGHPLTADEIFFVSVRF